MGKISFVAFVAKYLIFNIGDTKKMKKALETGDRETRLKYMQKTYSNLINGFCSQFDIKINIEGKENIPDGPVLYCANHSGMVDAAVIASMPGPIGIVLKKEFSKIPLFNTWLDNMNAIFIDRENPRQAVLDIQKGIDYLNDGYRMGIFPEGTRTRNDSVGEFKNGAFKMVQKTGVPIVPIAIKGSYKLWEEPGTLVPGTVNVQILPPVYSKDLDRKAYKELGQNVREMIVEQLDKME